MDKNLTGYSSEQRDRWLSEGEDYNRIAKESEAMGQIRARLAQQASGEQSDAAKTYAQIQQGQLQKQAMRAAYARGYDPAAQRAAMSGMADAQTDIAARVSAFTQQEQERAAFAYGEYLKNRQKMALMAEEAKKAYVMGNEKMAIQALDSARRAEVSAKGVQMMQANAKADANARMTSALIGAAGSAASYGASAGWFNSAPAITPVGAAPQAMQQAVPSMYGEGGIFASQPVVNAYNGPIAPQTPMMVAYK